VCGLKIVRGVESSGDGDSTRRRSGRWVADCGTVAEKLPGARGRGVPVVDCDMVAACELHKTFHIPVICIDRRSAMAGGSWGYEPSQN
jgi:hypothetical protein